MAKAAKKPTKAEPGKGSSGKGSNGKSPIAKASSVKGPSSKGSRASRSPVNLDAASSLDGLSIAQKISWFSLLAMVFIVPIAMSNWTWLGFKLPISYDQFDIVKVFFQRVLGLTALAGWGWHMFTRGGKVRHTPIDWLILAFLGWVTISMMFSIHPATAFFGKYRRFEGLLSFINYAVIYFLVLQFADRPSRIRAIAETLFWSSTLVAGYGMMQSMGRDLIDWHTLPFEANRPFATYGNPDLLGGFLMFSLPIALALALAEDHKWVRMIYWAGFGVNAYVWIVAFTRGAWIGGAVGIALMIVVAWRHSTKLSPWDWALAGLTTAAGAFAIVRSMSSTNEVLNFGTRFASILQFDKGSGLTRTEIWQAAISAVTYSPLRFVFGWGADTFRLVFPKFKPLAYTRDAGFLSVADNVHDYPLQLAAGIGVVGVVLMYAIFTWAATRSAKMVFAKSSDPNRVLLGGFWVAAAAYLTQLMFGLSVTGNTFLLWICIGVVLAPGAASFEVKTRDWGVVGAAFLLALSLAGIFYQFVLMRADYAYLIANVGMQGAQGTEAAKLAVRLNPFNDMYRAEVGMAYRQEMITAAQAGMQAEQAGQDSSSYKAVVKEKFDAAVASLKDTIAFVPYEYDNYVFLASVYNIGGSLIDPKYYQDAIEWSKKGMLIEPYGPAIRTEYARALLATGKTQEGIKQLKDAWDMDHAHSEAATMLAQEYAKLGRVADAVALLKQAQAANSTDTNLTELLKQLEGTATPASATPSGKK
jgi:hypothetical protein